MFSRHPGQLERSPNCCRHDNTLKSRGLWEIKAAALPRYSSQKNSFVLCCLLSSRPPPHGPPSALSLSAFIPLTFCLIYVPIALLLLLFLSDMFLLCHRPLSSYPEFPHSLLCPLLSLSLSHSTMLLSSLVHRVIWPCSSFPVPPSPLRL